MAAILRIFFCTILALHLRRCTSEAGYQLFPGFDRFNSSEDAADDFATLKITTIASSTDNNTTLSNVRAAANNSSVAKTSNRTNTISCEEAEHPSNIGPYEVPSQRDLVLLIRNKLTRAFSSYHSKVLRLLADIKQATSATIDIEKKCSINSRKEYKKCVRDVSRQCEMITKSLVISLERQKHDVMTVTKDNICNITAMHADPVELIKLMAMERASLEFALPGFLRLLSACSYYCMKPPAKSGQVKPIRHMTDQELVVKHFLTRKDYVQLIKGT